MKKIALVVAVFALLGLLGPLLGLFVLPISRTGGTTSLVYGFLYDLISLLWLLWGVAAMEVNVGSVLAGFWATTGNIVLFGIVGIVIAIIFKLIGRIIVVYVSCVLLFFLAFLWSTGFNLVHTNGCAVAIAFLLYMMPAYIIQKFVKKVGISPPIR